MSNRPDSVRSRALALFLILGTALGCSALPAVTPFADATVSLQLAVEQAGGVTVTELDRWEAGARTNADRLQTEWEARTKALAAMSAYADSLVAIVDAGNSGAQTAEAVVDSVSGLAEAVGYPIPMSKPAIQAATGAVKLIATQLAIARSARNLEDSLAAVQPAVEEVTNLIIKDLNDLDGILQAANQGNKNAFVNRPEFTSLLPQRDRLRRVIQNVDVNDAASREAAESAAALLASTEVAYQEYTAGLEAIEQRLRAGRALISETESAFRVWALTHQKLVTAVRERRAVDTSAIIATTIEIKELIRSIREQ